MPDDGRPSGRGYRHGRRDDAADALDARVLACDGVRRRRRVDVVEHGFRSYRREQRVDERGVRRAIRERRRIYTRMQMNAPRKRRTELLAAARQIAAVLVQSCKLAQPEREGIFRVLLESSQGRLRGRRDFPRELRAEAVGEEVAFRLARLRPRLREAIGESRRWRTADF